MSAMEEKLGTLEAANRTLNDQVVALSGAFDNFKSGIAQTADEQTKKSTALEARLGDLDKDLGELRQSIANSGLRNRRLGRSCRPHRHHPAHRAARAASRGVARRRSPDTDDRQRGFH